MKKREFKKVLSLLLSAAMVISLIPTTAAFAVDGRSGKKIMPMKSGTEVYAAGTDKAIMEGVSGMSGPVKETSAQGYSCTPSDYIYFGDTTAEFGDSVKWRVLNPKKTNSGVPGVFLLSERVINKKADKSGEGFKGYVGYPYVLGNRTYWIDSNGDDSLARMYCQGFLDYYINSEQNAVLHVSKTSPKSPEGVNRYFGLDWDYGDDELKRSALKDDTFFCLSIDEVVEYLGNYDKAPGLLQEPDDEGNKWSWWLRSGKTRNAARTGIVYSDGETGFRNCNEQVWDCGLRPAMNLDLEDILFSSAATGGKSTVIGLSEIPDYTGNEWKLTIKDPNRSGFAVDRTSITGEAGGEASFGYSGAILRNQHAPKTENEYISAILKDSEGKYLMYGKLKAVESESGTVTFKIPEGLSPGTYELDVFNEKTIEIRGTDLSSDFKAITLKVKPASVPSPIEVKSAKVTLKNFTVGKKISDIVLQPEKPEQYTVSNLRIQEDVGTDALPKDTIIENKEYLVSVRFSLKKGYKWGNKVDNHIITGNGTEGNCSTIEPWKYITPEASTADYTVKHMREKLNTSEGFDIAETETLTGVVGKETSAVAKKYTGFNLGGNTIEQKTITADGKTEVVIKYYRNKAKINFEANGGSGTTATQEFVYGQPETKLTKNTFTRDGYEFVKWTGFANGTGKAYMDEVLVDPSELCLPGIFTTYTLYAQWNEVTAPHTHTFVKVDGKVATCTEDGYKDYYKCDCGKFFEDAEGTTEISDLAAWKTGDGKLEKTGHKPGEWVNNDTHHWKECSVCHAELDKAEHTYGEWTVVTEATETTDGVKKHKCSVCGHEEKASIPAIPHVHSIELVNGQAATCTEDGYKDYYKCDCGKFFEDAEGTTEISDLAAWKTGDGKLEKTGHKPGEWLNDDTHHWKECSVCHAELDKAEHTYGEWTVVKEATSTEEGLEKRICPVCQKEETRVIPAKGEPEVPDKPVNPDDTDKPDQPGKPDDNSKPVAPAKPAATEKSEVAEKTEAPKTGDESNIMIWILLGAASLGIMTKRKNNN